MSIFVGVASHRTLLSEAPIGLTGFGTGSRCRVTALFTGYARFAPSEGDGLAVGRSGAVVYIRQVFITGHTGTTRVFVNIWQKLHNDQLLDGRARLQIDRHLSVYKPSSAVSL